MKRILFAIILAVAWAAQCFAATHTVYWTATTGGTYYAFPATQSLADWTTYRVALTEGVSANIGQYTGTLDDANGTSWYLFSGATQPTSWGNAVGQTSVIQKADGVRWNGAAVASPDASGYPVVTIKDGTGTGELDTASGKITLTTAEHTAIADAERDVLWSGAPASVTGTTVDLGETYTFFPLGSRVILYAAEGKATVRRLTANLNPAGGTFSINSAVGGDFSEGDVTHITVKATPNQLPAAGPGENNGLFIAGTNAQTTVTSGFGANSITATSLASDTITAAKIAPDAIGASEIAASAIALGTELSGFPSNFASFSIDANGRIDVGSWAGAATDTDDVALVDTAGLDSIAAAGAFDNDLVQSGSGNTITLWASASYPNNDLVGCTFLVIAGTGKGQTGVITANVQATDVITISPNLNTALDGTSRIGLYGTGGSSTVTSIADNVITANAISSTAASEIGTATWNVNRSGNSTAGTFGQGVASVQGNITGNVNGSVASVSGAVGSVTGNVTVGSFTTPALAELVATDTGEVAAGAGSVAAISQGSADPVAIRQEIDNNSTQLAAILADTGEIGTAGAGLTNITVAGLGSTAQSNIRTAVGLASANLDTQLLDVGVDEGAIADAVAAQAAIAAMLAESTSSNTRILLALPTAASGSGSGLATATNVGSVETDTQDIQDRLPTALVGGKMDAVADVTLSAQDKTDIAAEIASGVGVANIHNQEPAGPRVSKLGRRINQVIKAFPAQRIRPGEKVQVWIDCSPYIATNINNVSNSATSNAEVAIDSIGMYGKYVSIVLDAAEAEDGDTTTISADVTPAGTQAIKVALDVIVDDE